MDLKHELALLGGRLKQCRLDANKTQISCAEASGVTVRALRRMEKGREGVPFEQWLRVFEVLGRGHELSRLLRDQLPLIDESVAPNPRRASTPRRGAASRQKKARSDKPLRDGAAQQQRDLGLSGPAPKGTLRRAKEFLKKLTHVEGGV